MPNSSDPYVNYIKPRIKRNSKLDLIEMRAPVVENNQDL
jgi:hypothetical protein